MPDSSSPTTTAGLGLQIIRQHAASLAEHAPQSRIDSDPEHVHQTRVATRRLRAALRVFGKRLPIDADTLEEDLAWIAAQLGPARDHDVQARRLQTNAAELGLTEALTPYGGWLEEQRHRALEEFDAALQSPRFAQVMEHLDAMNRLEVAPDSGLPLRKEAPRRLRRAYRRLRKRARQLELTSPATDFHKVRIRAKRLRYTAEFFVAVYGKRAQRVAARATDLQDLLGDHQDGVVNTQRIHEATQTAAAVWPAETALALGQLVQWERQHGAELRGEVPRHVRALRKAWRRLKADF